MNLSKTIKPLKAKKQPWLNKKVEKYFWTFYMILKTKKISSETKSNFKDLLVPKKILQCHKPNL
jgi:hypothetical protein